MSKTNPVALVDIRVLDTVAGAKYVEDHLQGKLSIIFCDSDPDPTLEDDYLLEHGTVVRNNAHRNPSVTKSEREAGFWRSVYKSLSTDTQVVVSLNHYSHWQGVTEANARRVPIKLIVGEHTRKVEVLN